ncbi:hypothetical protein D7Y13_16240 [Corallococcus praedator]|uniref:Uncharacterized protein n=1 Tax=Corallococcus praedator TaxID=2316724 RepID=A0ABX9QHL8_9BACT|nr:MULTISPECIES: hypothetical protein [Corallococcus]RKH34059.1 hypothetical protein D7X75_09640 [Corallococcus sp. CA031C]RKI08278.1 hypothetical protein D7Y13_16240 [Corallococcus praedator]
MRTSRLGSTLSRSTTLPSSAGPKPRPPARAATLPASAPSSQAIRPAATRPAASAPTAPESKPLKHPGLPEGGPTYSPWEKTTGQASDVSVSGGANKLTPPPGARQNMLVDRPGNPFQKDTFAGGKVSGNVGSMQASTSSYSGGGVRHYSAQAEVNGPHAAYELQKTHAGRLGVTSGQLTAEANTFKGQAQAGVSLDRNAHAYTGALTAKAETGVGVAASASHDFNRHVGGYVKGEAKASATAYAEGVASLDPKTATAMLSGQVGAAATAGAYATAGGHVGRLHGSVTAGAVAGAAAQAGGKVGLENGFLKHSADVHTAAGVGTHLKSDLAVDLRHHIKPGIASGLRPALANATSVASPANALAPEKSRIENFFAKAFHTA